MNELVKKRADALFNLTRDYLVDIDGEDYDVAEAYKLGYLLQRGPKNFLNTFKTGELSLDEEAIRNTLRRFWRDLPDGYGELHSEEEQIIAIHNNEVKKLQERPQQNVLALRF